MFYICLDDGGEDEVERLEPGQWARERYHEVDQCIRTVSLNQVLFWTKFQENILKLLWAGTFVLDTHNPGCLISIYCGNF